jgi:hypothetical protein
MTLHPQMIKLIDTLPPKIIKKRVNVIILTMWGGVSFLENRV